MRVLFLTPQMPLRPDKGTVIRNLNLIKRVARHHEVDLLSFAATAEEEQGASALKDYCGRVSAVRAPVRPKTLRARQTFVSRWPDMALRLYSPAFEAQLGRWLAEGHYDVVQVEGIELVRYVLFQEIPRGERPAVVFDDHNAEYVLQRRAFETDVRQPAKWFGALYSFVQWQKLKGFERQGCRAADAVLAVSEVDRAAIRLLDSALEPVVVPNGIDAEYFGGYEATPCQENNGAVKPLVFVGTLDYRPNIDALTWFCLEILPSIEREMPAVRFWIVGRHPVAAVRRLASERVVVWDDVDDIRPLLAASGVYVVPMRIGGGVRFKLLEAMACRVPVVTTSMGADGIPAPPNQFFRIADEPAVFARAVVALLRDPERTNAMTRAAQRFVLRDYDWEVIVPQVERLYESLHPSAVSQRRGGQGGQPAL